MAQRTDIISFCEQHLNPSFFKDYAPNGLQVEGTSQIDKMVVAVTASRAAIEFAAANGAQMLLVHHGFFWKSEPTVITGWKRARIATLLQHDINLVGYHLPLDVHSEWGNNAQLAKKCGWIWEKSFGEQNLLNMGTLPDNQNTLEKILISLENNLQRKPTFVGDLSKPRQRIAWCTGGAQGFFQEAIDAGADVFVTGEISEPQFHLANETGVAFISAGHHATERDGVQALGAAIGEHFGIEVVFFDENNPA